MQSKAPSTSAASILAAGVAGLLLGCAGGDSADKDDRPPAPAGIVTTKQARQVPLDITRERFDALLGQKPVKVKKQRSRRRVAKLDKVPPEARRKLQEKFGRAKDGKVTIPAQTYTCLLYRGEQPKRFGWQFCFGEAGRLEYVATTPKPL